MLVMQSIGRGLRLAEDKDCLTVLDFIGQANRKYNFEDKFAALLSNTTRSVSREIKDGFIYGRGVSDQLGGAASMIACGKMLKELGYDGEYSVYFTFTCMEEDCDGIAWLYLVEKENLKTDYVVSTEPIRGDNPLLKAKNCIITPHMSWGSQSSRQRIMDCTVENVRAFLAGQPQNVVNK